MFTLILIVDLNTFEVVSKLLSLIFSVLNGIVYFWKQKVNNLENFYVFSRDNSNQLFISYIVRSRKEFN